MGNVEKTLKFLDSDEKKIVSVLIENNGEIFQSTLSNKTKLDSVKLHRRLLSLESKDVIHKAKTGMTNTINLSKDLLELFIK